MGVHTGDSITVAPIQTLSDVAYQKMRTASINILRAVGVDCGGSNVQFAVDPKTGRMIVIEMNPRVSRSSALASKATGFPIARSSAKLAVGYTLDEIINDVTGKTVSCFEPSLDYVAVKVPRFELEKFPRGYAELGTQMKSVGESLAIGRTFNEALNKAIRACEFGFAGLEDLPQLSEADLERMMNTRHPRRIFAAYTALKRHVAALGIAGADAGQLYDGANAGAAGKRDKTADQAALKQLHEIAAKTGFDPWFLYNMLEQIELELKIERHGAKPFGPELLLKAKRMGLADKRLAKLAGKKPAEVEAERDKTGIRATYHFVDTCSGEFEAKTPYFYSTYGELNEAHPMGSRGVVILASGPNRIGQGLEFDTCCTMSSLAYRKQGVKTVIINSNPETVSTDFNVSDRLYIEPLTVEDVKEILIKEGIKDVIVQLGGQTPLNMAEELEAWGAKVVGTSVEAIKAAEDRKLFAALMDKLGLRQPPNRTVTRLEDVKAAAAEVGFPVLVRPSFVLGGRAMRIVYEEEELMDWLAHQKGLECSTDRPILVDKFLEDAYEYDLDGLSDGQNVYVAGVMQHIEAAGIHSGDSACVFPSYKSSHHIEKQMIEACAKIAREIGVKGFINIQFAVKDDILYIIEVNPRASRTVPFIGKASGINLVEAAVRLWDGQDLRKQGLINDDKTGIPGVGLGECITGWAVKEAMFSFDRFRDVDPLLGPEMKSTGEVIGLGATFGEAFSKTQAATGTILPTKGTVFVTVNRNDRNTVLPIVRQFKELGFHISATRGTAEFLFKQGIFAEVVLKVHEGHPHIVDHMEHDRIDMVINTPLGRYTQKDDDYIRIEAVRRKIPYTTTIAAATAALEGIKYLIKGEVTPRALPEGRIVK
jgi:carbamoyl-phosphate synthase large subunit